MITYFSLQLELSNMYSVSPNLSLLVVLFSPDGGLGLELEGL